MPSDIEEERRLFYVAITRAQKEVTLTYASIRHRYGKEEFNKVSRFISEIDRKYLDGDVPQASAFDDFGAGGGWGGLGSGRSGYGSSQGGYGRQSQGGQPSGKWAPNYGRPQAAPSTPRQGYGSARPAAPVRPLPKAPTTHHTPSADFKPDRPEEIKVGMRVEHNIFGFGKITSLEGTGSDAKAVFLTDAGETKKLILKYAKLRICRQ